tara:strand:- start:129 stop:497 length:369 start_codon:yes stop_codon:yes gene_type:complete
MLPEYTKESLLPLALFNFCDNQEFKTYSDILKSNSPHLNKAEAFVSSCLKQYENQHLLIQLLLLFPNIAFSSISEFDLGELLNVKSVHNNFNHFIYTSNTKKPSNFCKGFTLLGVIKFVEIP